MIKYKSKTVKVTRNDKKGLDIKAALDEEIEHIYSCHKEEDILSMSITPTISLKLGLRYLTEYWIVYVYKYIDD